eukprot:2528754-Pleurochrysis_carterae.AAC.1
MLKLANHKLGLEHAIMRTGEHGEKALTATGFAKVERLTEQAISQRTSQIEQLLRRCALTRLSDCQRRSFAPLRLEWPLVAVESLLGARRL